MPVFLGLAEKREKNSASAIRLTHWQQFENNFGKVIPGSYLAYAVRGFFENGGTLCFVVRLDDISVSELARGMGLQASIEEIDLVCVPDIMKGFSAASELQQITAL